MSIAQTNNAERRKIMQSIVCGVLSLVMLSLGGCAKKSQPVQSNQSDKQSPERHSTAVMKRPGAQRDPSTVFKKYREAFARCAKMQAKAESTNTSAMLDNARACRRAWRAAVRSKFIEAGFDPVRVPVLIDRWVNRQLGRANARLRKRYGPPPKRMIE